MPPAFIASFAQRLDNHCALKVVEARSGMPVEPSVCYVAPGGMHLCLHRKMTGEVVIRTPTTPLTLFRPSVGVMMASVLNVYGIDTIGVLMTGIGDDGADQMVAIRQAGGYTIAESEQTAVVYGNAAGGLRTRRRQRGGTQLRSGCRDRQSGAKDYAMGDLTEFVAKLESSDETERIYAAEDIGYLNASEGVAPLLARLDQEPSRAVRDAIFQALTRIDADASMEGCIRLLESDDPQIRNQAVDILRRKGDAAIPMLTPSCARATKTCANWSSMF